MVTLMVGQIQVAMVFRLVWWLASLVENIADFSAGGWLFGCGSR